MPPVRSLPCLSAALCAALAVGPAHGQLSAAVSLTSDYVWRGFSKSDGHLAGQAYVDYQHPGGIYGGVFLSSVDLDDAYGYGGPRYGARESADSEVVPYVGYSFSPAQDWRLDTQWSMYIFDDQIFGNASSYQEIYLFAHFRDLLTAELAVAPDAYGQDAATVNAQLTGRYPVSAAVTASAGGGWFEAAEVLGYDYLHWHAGLTWYHRRGGVDVRYFGSAERNGTATPWPYDPPPANGEVVITVTFGF